MPELIDTTTERRLTAEEAVEVIASVRQWGDFGFTRAELFDRLAPFEPLDAAAATRGFFDAYAERHGKRRWGDKTPIYVEHIPQIAATLEEARFIHLIRDGRDVALSRSTWSEGEIGDLAKAARRWRKRIERAREDAAELDSYLEIRYEDLVLDTESTLRRVCELLELDFDPGMLTYHQRAEERLAELGNLPAQGRKGVREAADRLAIHRFTKEPPKREHVARWKSEMGPRQREVYEAEAGGLLAELGYETGGGLAS